MTFGEWIQSFGMGTSGNNIIWVGFDNKTLYIAEIDTEGIKIKSNTFMKHHLKKRKDFRL